MSDIESIDQQIRVVLLKHAHLSRDTNQIGIDDDLYHAGLTSLSTVNVMLGLEDAFEIEFPDHMLTKKVFTSIGSIRAAIMELVS